MDRKILVLMIGILIAIMAISNACALGISPGRTTVDFSPGVSNEVTFTVMNSEHKDINLVVSVQGDLKDYVVLRQSSLSMKADEAGRELSYSYKLPASLTPGLHAAEIVVLQLPESSVTSEAYVRAAIAVVTQLHVNVPYPGKYAEADMHIIDADQGGDVTFVFPVVSRGNLDLVSVKANVDVYNTAGEKIESFNTREISVLSGERKEIVEKWKADVPIGNYRAVATLIYDGESIRLEKQFSVGSFVLELQEVTVSDFSLGDIAKFEMLVENKWSEPISGAYVNTKVFDANGQVMADFKSAAYDIEPLTKKVLTSYWDTKGVRIGTYDSSVYLNYGSKSSQKDLQLKVSETNIEIIGLGYVISEKGQRSTGNSSLTTILIAAVVVLVLINLLWFLYLRKRLKGSK